MSFYGADVEQLRDLSTQLLQNGDELEAIASRLTSRIDQVQWRGPDADRFRADWQGSHVATIRRALQLLRDASGKALENARQQEETSQGSGGFVGFTGLPESPIIPVSPLPGMPGYEAPKVYLLGDEV